MSGYHCGIIVSILFCYKILFSEYALKKESIQATHLRVMPFRSLCHALSFVRLVKMTQRTQTSTIVRNHMLSNASQTPPPCRSGGGGGGPGGISGNGFWPRQNDYFASDRDRGAQNGRAIAGPAHINILESRKLRI